MSPLENMSHYIPLALVKSPVNESEEEMITQDMETERVI